MTQHRRLGDNLYCCDRLSLCVGLLLDQTTTTVVDAASAERAEDNRARGTPESPNAGQIQGDCQDKEGHHNCNDSRCPGRQLLVRRLVAFAHRKAKKPALPTSKINATTASTRAPLRALASERRLFNLLTALSRSLGARASKVRNQHASGGPISRNPSQVLQYALHFH